MLLRRAGILPAVVLGVVLGGSVLPGQALVCYQGRWMRKYDVEKLKYAGYMRAHGYVRYFGRWRRKAEVEALRHGARRRRYRIRREARRCTVTMGINLQHTRLLGLDTVPVSLGVGTPVRIQLPRIRSVRIGTTVTVPAGIGR